MKLLKDAGLNVSDGENKNTGYFKFDGDIKTTAGVLKNYQDIKTAMDAISNSGIYKNTDNMLKLDLYTKLQDRYTELNTVVETYNSSISDLNTNLSQQQMLTALQGKELPKTKEEFTAFEDSLVNTAIASGKFVGSQEQIKASIENYLATQPEFISFFDAITISSDKSTIAIRSFKDALSDETATKAIDSFQSSMKSIQDALSSDKLSSSDIIDLMQQFSDFDWNKYGVTGAKGIGNLDEALKALAKSELDTLSNTVDITDAFNQMYENAIKSTSALDNLAEANGNVTTALSDSNIILDAITKKHALNDEQVKTLMSRYEGFEDNLIRTTNGWYLEEGAINVVNTAITNLKTAYSDAQESMTELAQSNANKRFLAFGIDLAGITTMDGALTELEMAFSGRVGLEGNDTALNEMTSFIKQWYGLAEELNKGKDNLLSGSNTQTDFNKILKPDKSEKKDPQWLTEFNDKKDYYKYQLDMDEINEAEYYDKLEKLVKDKLEKHKDKYLDLYRQNQTELHKGRKQIDENLIKSKFDVNENAYNLGEKSESEYYATLEDLNEKYYKNNLDFASEYQSNLEKLYNYDQKALKDAYQKKSDTINKIISKYGELREAINKTAKGQTGDAQVDTYANGIKYANKEIKYIENEIKKLNKKKITVNFTQDDYDSQLENLQSALSEAYSSIEDFNKSISESTSNSLDELAEAFEKAYEKDTENLEDQKDNYSDIIDAQKEILKLKKEQNDYEKDIADKTKDISKIENRMADLAKAASSGDRQANAELLKLEEDLAKEKEDLADTQSDHEYDLANDALDKAKDDNDEIADAKIEALKTQYEKQKSFQEELSNQLIQLVAKGKDYTVQAYSDAIDEIVAKMASININMDSGTVSGLKSAQAQTGNNANSVYSILGSKSSSNTGKADGLSQLNQYLSDQGYKTVNKETMVSLAQSLGLFDINGTEDVQDTTEGRVNKNRIMEELKRILGDSTFKTGGIGEVVGSLGEDGIGLFKNKEALLSEFDSKNFKDFVPIMNDITKYIKLNIPDTSKLITNKNNLPDINITIPIAGNATPATVTALNNASNNIVKQIMSEVRKL